MVQKFIIRCLYMFVLICASCSAAPEGQDATQSNGEQEVSSDGEKASSDGVRVNKPVIVPPGFDERPGDDNKRNVETLPNGLPALGPMKGLNVDTLFSENVDDTDKRFKRLETAFVDFRKEYEQVKPAIVRLAAIEDDMQDLIAELESFVSNETVGQAAGPVSEPVVDEPIAQEPLSIVGQANEPVSAGPEPEPVSEDITQEEPPVVAAPPTPAVADKAEAETQGAVLVQAIRTGIHPDKVRIVIELSGKPDYTVDLDNAEDVLLCVFSGSAKALGAAKQKTLPSNPALTSYSLEETADGALQVILNLKKDTKILKQEWIGPSAESASHRLVIDLKI